MQNSGASLNQVSKKLFMRNGHVELSQKEEKTVSLLIETGYIYLSNFGDFRLCVRVLNRLNFLVSSSRIVGLSSPW